MTAARSSGRPRCMAMGMLSHVAIDPGYGSVSISVSERTTRTGHGAWRTTWSDTLPIPNRPMTPLVRLPTTTISGVSAPGDLHDRLARVAFPDQEAHRTPIARPRSTRWRAADSRSLALLVDPSAVAAVGQAHRPEVDGAHDQQVRAEALGEAEGLLGGRPGAGAEVGRQQDGGRGGWPWADGGRLTTRPGSDRRPGLAGRLSRADAMGQATGASLWRRADRPPHPERDPRGGRPRSPR